MTTTYQQAPAPPEEPLRRLVRQGVITEAQAAAVREAQELAPGLVRADAPPAETLTGEASTGRWWAEVAGYLGGVLVLGAGAVLLATTWDRLTDLSRGGLLSAITVALVVAAVALAGGPVRLQRLARGEAPARRRVVGVLLAAGVPPIGASGLGLGLWRAHDSPPIP